jgi:DNA-binding IclR family transcriptional regulator
METKMTQQTKSKYMVPAVVRTFEILRSLKKTPQSLAELSRNVQINKSTCLNILRTLEEEYVVQIDPGTGKYQLGVGLIELGASASEYYTHIVYAKQLIAQYEKELQCTFIFYQRVDRYHVTPVDKIEPQGRIKVTVPIGTRVPIQGGSFGRCYLAYDSEEIRQDVLKNGLFKFTPMSIQDIDQFYKEMEMVRERGWSEDREGFAMGINTVAAPIFDKQGNVVLLLGALGINSVMTSEKMKEYGKLVKGIAEKVSKDLTMF